MAFIFHAEDPICYLHINNSWYSISSVQLSMVNNSLLRKFSITAFVYSTTMTFSTQPASLPSCSSILVSSVSEVQLYFCYYCGYLHLQLGIDSLWSALTATSWALWVAILFSESLSDSASLPFTFSQKCSEVDILGAESESQLFLRITCKPGKKSIVKSDCQTFSLSFLIERRKLEERCAS